MLRIQKTTNYNQFKFFEGENRVPHPKMLIESISRKNMLEEHPIICDTNLYVIDGQNRLKAAEELQTPIYYVVSESMSKEDIALCQNQAPWQMSDFLRFFKTKNPDYIFVKEMVDLFKLPIHIVVHACGGSDKSSFKKFRSGDYIIKKDKDILRRAFKKISDLIGGIESINLMAGKKIHKVKSKTFEALWDIVLMPGYDHKRMCNQIESQRDNVLVAQEFSSRESIRNSLIKRVYDFKRQNKTKLEE